MCLQNAVFTAFFHILAFLYILYKGEIMKRRIFLLALLIICVFILSSCDKQIKNYADELTSSNWKSVYDNGNTAQLNFENDNACFILTTSSNNKAQISGFCEISDDSFVIHDDKTNTAFVFKYKVNFDCVDIIYDENTLSLKKIYT